MEKINNLNIQDILKLSCHHQIQTSNSGIRYCKNKCKNNDYCHIHLKLYNSVSTNNKENITNTIINTTFLDENFNYTLMGLYNSWADMDENEIIYIDEEYWNIDIIVSHFTQQLNMSYMENPYPIYPNSPFTRKLFSVESLIILRDKLKELKKPVNIALKLLLTQSTDNLELIYDNVDQNNFSKNIMDLFENNYRYMLINCKNSQNVYVGFWVNNQIPFTPFEKLYKKLKNMPYQVIFNGYLMFNDKRNVIENKIEKCNNKYDILDAKFCEIV